MTEQRYPPVTQLAMTSLALVVIGGIYLSSHLPGHVSLGVPIVLVVASFLLLGTNLFALSRVPGFAWDRFFEVGRWALLAYLLIAGMIEYAFLQNHVHGGPLLILTLSLLLFSLHVPTLIAFTVARYEQPDDATGSAHPAA